MATSLNNVHISRYACLTFLVSILLLSVLSSIHSFNVDISYAKKHHHDDDDDDDNKSLPTENHGTTSQERSSVYKEYTDMPIDSPLYISSHSKHSSKIFGDKTLSLNGEIKNNGTETAEFVQITATFYNEHNVTLGSDFAYTNPTSIDPGQSAPYKMDIGFGDDIEVDDIDHIKYHVDWD